MSAARSFARTGFARFINTPAGRVLRIVAGLLLLYWGFTERATGRGLALMVVSLVPLLAGSFDWCLVSGLLGGPWSGVQVRDAAKEGE